MEEDAASAAVPSSPVANARDAIAQMQFEPEPISVEQDVDRNPSDVPKVTETLDEAKQPPLDDVGASASIDSTESSRGDPRRKASIPQKAADQLWGKHKTKPEDLTGASELVIRRFADANAARRLGAFDRPASPSRSPKVNASPPTSSRASPPSSRRSPAPIVSPKAAVPALRLASATSPPVISSPEKPITPRRINHPAARPGSSLKNIPPKAADLLFGGKKNRRPQITILDEPEPAMRVSSSESALAPTIEINSPRTTTVSATPPLGRRLSQSQSSPTLEAFYSHPKLLDRLGVSMVEAQTFSDVPKAYNLLGAYDTRPPAVAASSKPNLTISTTDTLTIGGRFRSIFNTSDSSAAPAAAQAKSMLTKTRSPQQVKNRRSTTRFEHRLADNLASPMRPNRMNSTR